jgi:hypothetical protein
MQSKTFATLERPRFTSCSFYPFTYDQEGEAYVLFRHDKHTGEFRDFGDQYDSSTDSSIIQTAARSFLLKTSGMMAPMKLERRMTPSRIEKTIEEYS